MTQQDTVVVLLTNASGHACRIGAGYPSVSLFTADHRLLPFRYERSGDQEITSRPPRPVRLAPGGHVYAAVNENTCVSRERRIARTIVLALAPDVALRASLRTSSVTGYCPADDFGHHVEVSPIVARERQVWNTGRT